MDEILRLRFQDRDKAFEEELNSIKNNMAGRGLLNSGNTVKAGHDALIAELVGSRQTIVTTISENLRITSSKQIDAKLIESSIHRLRGRKEFLERFYLEKMKPVTATLQNKKALEPYTNLNKAIEINEHELRVELAQAIADFVSSQGETLYHRIQNQFLNRPLVVIGVITFAVVIAILTFVSSLLDLF